MADDESFTYPEMCQANLIDLCGEVKRILDKLYKEKLINFNPILITIGQGILSKYVPDVIIDNFIKNTCQHWEKINEKDENFFIENAGDLLKDYPVGDIDPFKEIFKNNYIDDNDKELLWEYLESLIKISIIYIHQERKPYYIENDDGIKKKSYDKNYQYQPQVPIIKMANLYNVKLEWPEN